MLSIPVVGGGVGAAVVVVGFGFCDTSPKKIFLKHFSDLLLNFYSLLAIITSCLKSIKIVLDISIS